LKAHDPRGTVLNVEQTQFFLSTAVFLLPCTVCYVSSSHTPTTRPYALFPIVFTSQALPTFPQQPPPNSSTQGWSILTGCVKSFSGCEVRTECRLKLCKGRTVCFAQNSSKSMARYAIRVELSKTADFCFVVSFTHFKSKAINSAGFLQLTNCCSTKQLTRTC